MGFTGRQIIGIAEVLFVRTRCLLDCAKMCIDKYQIVDKKVEEALGKSRRVEI